MSLRFGDWHIFSGQFHQCLYGLKKNEPASGNVPREAAGIIGLHKHTRSTLLKIPGQHWQGRPGDSTQQELKTARMKCLDLLVQSRNGGGWGWGLRGEVPFWM